MTDEKPMDFNRTLICMTPSDPDPETNDAMKVLLAASGLTLTEALSRLRCPLSPEQVVERLKSIRAWLFRESHCSDPWMKEIDKLLADLTAATSKEYFGPGNRNCKLCKYATTKTEQIPCSSCSSGNATSTSDNFKPIEVPSGKPDKEAR